MRGALAFLTIVGRSTTPDRRSLTWFGPVGAAVGAVCGLVRWGAGGWWAPALAAAMTVMADLVLTGMLHLDGLADAADGLLAPMDRERRLVVMATPGIGAFAAGAVGSTLLLRWAALATLAVEGWRWVALLGGLWCASRVAMAAIVGWLPHARPDGGVATLFAGSSRVAPIAVGLPLALVGVAVGGGWGATVGLAVGTLTAAGTVALARRRIGGFTGDVVGAAGFLLETVALVVAAASW